MKIDPRRIPGLALASSVGAVSGSLAGVLAAFLLESHPSGLFPFLGTLAGIAVGAAIEAFRARKR